MSITIYLLGTTRAVITIVLVSLYKTRENLFKNYHEVSKSGKNDDFVYEI